MSTYKKFPSDFWQGSAAENVLFDLVNETHQPLQTIKGFSQALLKANLPKNNETEWWRLSWPRQVIWKVC